MEQRDGKVALITGANVGIGKEVARQLAVQGRYRKIYLACRNQGKASLAKTDLEKSAGNVTFEIVVMDVSSLASVRTAMASLQPIDDLFMNAGGSGGKAPLTLTSEGVTEIFAANVLGHVVLLEGLIQTDKLKSCAILVGSEAARGVPKLGIKRPVLRTSSADEFATVCDGSFFHAHKFEVPLAYGQVKYMGALWLAALARRSPDLRMLTISPGNTSGTEGLRDLPLPTRLLAQYVLMPFVMPLFGMVHGVDKGAERLVTGVTDKALRSGVFYASDAKSLIGPLTDQSQVMADLANTRYQDNAYEAIHRFIK